MTFCKVSKQTLGLKCEFGFQVYSMLLGDRGTTNLLYGNCIRRRLEADISSEDVAVAVEEGFVVMVLFDCFATSFFDGEGAKFVRTKAKYQEADARNVAVTAAVNCHGTVRRVE